MSRIPLTSISKKKSCIRQRLNLSTHADSSYKYARPLTSLIVRIMAPMQFGIFFMLLLLSSSASSSGKKSPFRTVQNHGNGTNRMRKKPKYIYVYFLYMVFDHKSSLHTVSQCRGGGARHTHRPTDITTYRLNWPLE